MAATGSVDVQSGDTSRLRQRNDSSAKKRRNPKNEQTQAPLDVQSKEKEEKEEKEEEEEDGTRLELEGETEMPTAAIFRSTGQNARPVRTETAGVMAVEYFDQRQRKFMRKLLLELYSRAPPDKVQLAKTLSTWSRWRLYCLWLVLRPSFNITADIIIVINSISLGVIAAGTREHDEVAKVINYVCLAFFSVEFFIRSASRVPVGMNERWFVLDIDILILCGCDLVLEMVNKVRQQDHSPWLGAVTVLRLMRVVRGALEKVTKIAIDNDVGGMFHCVGLPRGWLEYRSRSFHTLFSSVSHLPELCLSAAFFLIAGYFITATVVTTLYHSRRFRSSGTSEVAEEYFDEIPVSVLTLFKALFGGLAWSNLVEELTRQDLRFDWLVGSVMLISSLLYNKIVLGNIVLGMFLRETIDQAKNWDDRRDERCRVDVLKIKHKIRHALLTEGFHLHSGLSFADMARAFKQLPPDLPQRLDMEETFYKIDAHGKGRIRVDDILDGLLSDYCNERAVPPRVLEPILMNNRQSQLLYMLNIFDKESNSKVRQLVVLLKNIANHCKQLYDTVEDLHRNTQNLSQELRRNLEETHHKDDRELAWVATLQKTNYSYRVHTARCDMESGLDRMTLEVNQLQCLRKLRDEAFLERRSVDALPGLREAVRTQLDIEVGPWLKRALARKRRQD